MIKQLQNKLSTDNNVLFGYLFGSYASGTPNSRSDVDMALFLKNTSLDAQLQINYELSKLLRKDVDLVVLNSIKNIYLLEDILRNGVLLKDNQGRIEFELKKEHEILDYKAFKRYIDAITNN